MTVFADSLPTPRIELSITVALGKPARRRITDDAKCRRPRMHAFSASHPDDMILMGLAGRDGQEPIARESTHPPVGSRSARITAKMSDRPDKPPDLRGQITHILQDPASSALDRAEHLLPLVYEELRRLARARMAREGEGQTIQATALVHEAFLRIVGESDPGWNGRGHFFGAAALAMRRILVEQARRKRRHKHGGAHARVDFDEAFAVVEPPAMDVQAVDDAVRKLEAEDPRKGSIVNLRYFAGLTAEETAQALGVSLGTVEREWRFIKAWLREELDETGEPGSHA